MERAEQALFALLGDPENPVTAAARAREILTTVPSPQSQA